ncbi:MAG TPA: cation/multidrug efflux pump [Spongiibacteraceae bacterium]|jgi:hypothetical protein
MIYLSVAIVLALIAVLVLLLALRLLIGNWILGWLRGSLGLLLAGVAVVFGLSAWDLRNYEQVLDAKPIGTLAFNKLDDKQFNVTMVDHSGNEQRYQLSGDLWQLDVRLLKWIDTLARLGVKPGYRLDRLSGRYLSLEDEQKLPHTVVSLRDKEPLFDVWSWLRQANRYFSLIDAQYGSAAYLPMVDGALYSINIGPSGVVAYPLNERAKLAVDQWQ